MRLCGASPAAGEGSERGGRGLTCGQVRGAAAARARSPCSAGTARTAAGKPSSAPSAKAPRGHPAQVRPRARSSQGPPGSQPPTRGDGAAVGVEIKAGSSRCQPHHGSEGRRARRLKGSPMGETQESGASPGPRGAQRSLGAHAARQRGRRAGPWHSNAPGGTTASGSQALWPGEMRQ